MAHPPGRLTRASPKAGQQGAQHQNGGAHGFHQFVGRFQIGDVACIQLQRAIALLGDTQLSQQLQGGVDVTQTRDIVQVHRVGSQQTGAQNGQGGVFGARDGDLAIQALSACDA